MIKNRSIYIKAGYTHLITYKELLEWANAFVEKSFPTTADMVEKYVARMNNKSRNRHGELAVTDICVIPL